MVPSSAMAKMPQSAIDVLDDRFEGLMDRLKQVEKWCSQVPTAALDLRFSLINEHLKQLETRLAVPSCPQDAGCFVAGASLSS